MIRLLQPLLMYLSAAPDRELARQLQFALEQIKILRSKLPKRIALTLCERNRLIKFGKGLGPALKHLIDIVSVRTFNRWLNAAKNPLSKNKCARKPGRPPKPADLRELILRIAGETGWGYTRILGELKKLGVSVARSTVVNILKEHGLDPGPRRGEGTWSEFIKRHAETLWACDFFSKKVWTLGGMVDVFVLFFIHIGTRRVYVTGITANPDAIWMKQQARNFSMSCTDGPTPPQYPIMDMDAKFTAEFREVLENDGIESVRVGPRAPNMNARAERFVLSIKSECLDHFVAFSQKHLQYLIDQYLQYYNLERPHQGVDNRPLEAASEPATLPFPTGEVVCEDRLGGLLKHYHRQAA